MRGQLTESNQFLTGRCEGSSFRFDSHTPLHQTKKGQLVMTDKEKLARLRRELTHDKTCWYGAHGCSHPEARAKREIERLLGESITPHADLDADEKWRRENAHYSFGE